MKMRFSVLFRRGAFVRSVRSMSHSTLALSRIGRGAAPAAPHSNRYECTPRAAHTHTMLLSKDPTSLQVLFIIKYFYNFQIFIMGKLENNFILGLNHHYLNSKETYSYH